MRRERSATLSSYDPIEPALRQRRKDEEEEERRDDRQREREPGRSGRSSAAADFSWIGTSSSDFGGRVDGARGVVVVGLGLFGFRHGSRS